MSDHSYYKVGGSLEYQHPAYVVRQADYDLYRGLKNGEFCYVLNSRQMGKSSLRVQTMKKLKTEGIKCATIDMTRIGSHITPTEWYGGVVSELIRGFSLSKKVEFSTWWRQRDLLSPVQRLGQFVEDVLLKEFSEKIVIFIDEIDSILKVNFRCDFFAFIRGCYNRRADDPDYNRLMFCLLGVAAPSDLITDKAATPFNIGRAVSLTGFQLHEVEPLAQGLVGKVANPQTILAEILAWTGGQPFLTQKLCKLISNSEEPIAAGQESYFVEELVRSRIISNWETQDEPEHLRTIRDRILHSLHREELLNLYQQILQSKEIKSSENLEYIELRLSGLVVKRDEKLKIYNPIYELIFNLDWVKSNQKGKPITVNSSSLFDKDDKQLQMPSKQSALQTIIPLQSSVGGSVSESNIIAECQEYGLSDRECQIWLLLKQDYRRQEIASRLGITLNTVKRHVKNIYVKIRLDDDSTLITDSASTTPIDSPKLVTTLAQNDECFIDEFAVHNSLVRIYKGDITNLVVDVIVSSDDTDIKMNGSVGARILEVGGYKIFEEAQGLVPLSLGEVGVTTVGQLQAKKVFHGAVIDWHQEILPSAEVIQKVVHTCMTTANQLRFESIAFPLLGTGAGRFPVKAAWNSILAQVANDLADQDQSIKEIVLVLYGSHVIRAIRD